MNRKIRKVAILGSGIMGSRIACHFANIGVEVLLLDICPSELNDSEISKSLSLDHPLVRNRIVNEALSKTLKSKPSPIYDQSFSKRITTGNFDDDMENIASCDWIIEAVIEDLKIKKLVFDKVELHRKAGTLISTNTSGIPIHMMTEGRSDDFNKHFAGTHFFNPPRYLPLLEIIPTKHTDSKVIDFYQHFGKRFLGKTTVLCKDTPAFIGNRIGIFTLLKTFESMQKFDLNIDEIDKLTGTIIGRPKSATFRTCDVVGFDTFAKVSDFLYHSLPNDESRNTFKMPDFCNKMIEKKWLGDKTKQGFYKKTKNEKGEKIILTLNLSNFEYESRQKVSFASLELAKNEDSLEKRIKQLISSKDKAGLFLKDMFFGLFKYVSHRLPEITESLYKIDDATKAGFGWELGPFQLWDALGVEKTTKYMEEAGYNPAPWVNEMIKKGIDSFYQINDGIKSYYNIEAGEQQKIPGIDNFIILKDLKGTNREVWSDSGTTLYDIGDGIVNLEFHTKMNTMGSEVIQGINKAIDDAERNYKGLVIANEGQNFSAGANLGLIFMHAIEQEFDEIDFMIRSFQKTMMRARYSSIPVVVAPHAMTLGGGCELTLHANAVQAAAETYIGLVEFGVGLIPAGGGTKEMALRISDAFHKGDVEYNQLQEVFMNIATAKVATSAHEAINQWILRECDGISVNRQLQIADAKAKALLLANQGFVQPHERKDVKVQGKGAMALFLTGIHGMKIGNYISEHDAKIAQKLAYVICGGDLSSPTLVSEQYLLDLEREAFLSLTGEKKTLERIQAILKGGKPLRN
ncbi:3-hydroxyacyl-CoA dehydrogenase/enoyl-CoA hydratase family protein [Aureibacter tunicatorum]|uniref:3-hydroxyacyl-CoA dehydrogenase n=1 Tax=Aureibacter tunicatorum TaxID=866807 RepID=A0AAE3XMK8_9BACT|nr:3-hydroxyacyl-CoA dehydrogenase NAD-binding domain-containing protein [Aureibacter tunicatorum]MDR6237754.1 3-hydroxyacyl-CoA dehydrogenase [Aureibacter tunicatorum]BDD02789.1 3-hydroxyacyl-CoA dehydrogenase [Aureibacter tunicatorum]